MDAALWQAVEEVFTNVVDLPEDEQASSLSRLCGDRSELRTEVESLLSAHRRTGSFMEPIPERVGPYRLLDEIARGGMGVVFRARRADGQFEHHVAVKILRHTGSSSLYKRFVDERQILANLSHPNIARLLDGGITPSGASYIVMEFVDGVPIGEYCRHRPILDRLALFRAVCAAVHYAHQHLVVHRDLKPANILVGPDGSPKLLDFGIARILAPDRPSDQTTVLPAMTPDYASPEQIRGARISTASDIYALGVLLHELMTGRRPYTLTGRTYDEIIQIVCEQKHERPSTGSKDVDAIVARAMRPDPSDRYASAEALSADIDRYLRRLPVDARRGAAWYGFSKFVMRRWPAVAAVTLAFVVLGSALAMTVRQSRLAEARFQDVRRLANAVMFELHDSVAALPGSTAARKLIVAQGLDHLDRLSKDSAGDGRLQRELAAGYIRLGDVQGFQSQANLGDARGAIESYRKAYALMDALSKRDPDNVEVTLDLAKASRRLGLVLVSVRENDEARTIVAESVTRLEALVNRVPTDAHHAQLAAAYNSLADVSGNSLEPRYKALAILERLLASEPENPVRQRDVALVHKNIASPLVLRSEGDRALPHLRRAEALDAARAASQPNDRETQMDLSFDYSQNGTFYANRERHDEALANFEKALAIRRRLAELDPADARLQDRLVYAYSRVGMMHLALNRPADAMLAYQEAARIGRALLLRQPNHPQFMSNLAVAQAGLGDAAAALRRTAEACAARREASGVYAGLDRQGRLRADERKAFESVQRQLVSCAR
jgi:eukaryotic-like serine/threonine-protein kinase